MLREKRILLVVTGGIADLNRWIWFVKLDPLVGKLEQY